MRVMKMNTETILSTAIAILLTACIDVPSNGRAIDQPASAKTFVGPTPGPGGTLEQLCQADARKECAAEGTPDDPTCLQDLYKACLAD